MSLTPFSAQPPEWTSEAAHSTSFLCPRCKSEAATANQVWINRRAPALTPENRRIWQEFYHCHCGQAWWAWSSDRPPNPNLTDETDSL